jgi:hypothetical protein
MGRKERASFDSKIPKLLSDQQLETTGHVQIAATDTVKSIICVDLRHLRNLWPGTGGRVVEGARLES